jgi:hypothetical protein
MVVLMVVMMMNLPPSFAESAGGAGGQVAGAREGTAPRARKAQDALAPGRQHREWNDNGRGRRLSEKRQSRRDSRSSPRERGVNHGPDVSRGAMPVLLCHRART